MRRVPLDAAILTADAMRAAEAQAFARGVSQSELMARAGLGVAREVHRHAGGRPILFLAGPGNNGGDAYVAARHLADWGHDVMVAALGEPREGAAVEAMGAWRGPRTDFAAASARPVLVDGLFGTGLSRPLDGVVGARLAALTGDAAFVVAIDLPSGLDTDRGKPLGCASVANLTVALGALKPAHLLGKGQAVCGRVVLADIGIPIERAWTTLARPAPLAVVPQAHKYTRGLACVIGGAMPGAARLAAGAAARAGAGYVVLTTETEPTSGVDSIVVKKITEKADYQEILTDNRIASLLVGSGLGRCANAARKLDAALGFDGPLVLDGDALSLLGEGATDRLRDRKKATILTPHEGEFGRMFGQGSGSKILRTLDAARASGATVIHKGPDTVIADPAGRVVVGASAPATLATAGSGDVLAGIVAGRLAAGEGAASDEAPATAAWLHMRAAEQAGPGLIADDLIDALRPAVGELW